MNTRRLIATSHAGRYSYWLDPDRYVYQYDDLEDRWIGWICAESVWESTFSYAKWIDLV